MKITESRSGGDSPEHIFDLNFTAIPLLAPYGRSAEYHHFAAPRRQLELCHAGR